MMPEWLLQKWLPQRWQKDGHAQAQSLRTRLQALPTASIDADCPLSELRFVVLDFETTGLNVRKDVPIALGAVAIENGRIQLGGQFERLLYQPESFAGPATLVHEIAPGEIELGDNLSESLVDFYEYAGNGILIAFHAPFDKAILKRASQKHLRVMPSYPFLDLEDIVCAFFPAAAKTLRGLDAWCEHFGFDLTIDRHNAAADALISAELLLVILRQAASQGITTWTAFTTKIAEQVKLQRQQHFL